MVLPVSDGGISNQVLSFSEPVCSALQSVFTGLHGAHDGKPRTWCVVGVPQALAVFIVYMIVFSKLRRVGVHFLPRQCACPKGGPGWFPGTGGIVVVQQPSWLLGQPQASVLSYVWLFLFFNHKIANGPKGPRTVAGTSSHVGPKSCLCCCKKMSLHKD